MDGSSLSGSFSRDVLTSDEMTRLVRACSCNASTGIRNRALIAIVYRGGLRVSELIGLDAHDVDAHARTIRVASTRVRLVKLDSGATRLVETWTERRREAGLDDARPFLCTLQRQRLKASYVRALLPRLARKAGIGKRVSTESIRRTLAVELVREGAPIEEIQARLGHASPDTTYRYLARATAGAAMPPVAPRPEWRP